MTVRNLDALLKPRRVVMVGASERPGSIGTAMAARLAGGGLAEPPMFVNPGRTMVAGLPCYASVDDLPSVPDLAILNVKIEAVPALVAQVGALGTRAVMVVAELGPEGAPIRQAILNAARPYLLRVLGPNCLGLSVPAVGLEAGLGASRTLPGRLAFLGQSNTVAGSITDWAASRGIGFSHVLSMGEMIDVDIPDLLDHLSLDRGTDAILLYLHSVVNARKFMSAARAAARLKPVIVIKAGRHAIAARAAATHARVVTGNDDVHDAAFRRAGMLRVGGLDELFEAVDTLARGSAPAGNRLAIVCNGGGTAVMAADAVLDGGGRLPDLAPATRTGLAAIPGLRTHDNPVDLGADASPARYGAALGVLADDRGLDAVLVLNAPSAISESVAAAQATIEVAHAHPRARFLTCWLGDGAAGAARSALAAAGLPTFETPEAAVRGFVHLVQYRRNQDLLLETPPSTPEEIAPRTRDLRERIAGLLAAGREWITGPEALALVALAGIPVVEARVARDAEAAVDVALDLGGPVALKILSSDIAHKRAVGGVALDLATALEVAEAARVMLRTVAAEAPDARIEGFMVAPMVRRAHAVEVLLSAYDDEQFGPVIVFGHGGSAAEVIDDAAVCLPPLNVTLARECMSRTRVINVLGGFPGQPAADLDALAVAMIELGRLVADVPEVAEVEINPLIADPAGVLALDARIRIAPARVAGDARLAIRPYPAELEETVTLADGTCLLLRPIMPEDEAALHAGFARMDPEHIRLRFFAALKQLPHKLAAKLSQIDYDREMAFVLVGPGVPGRAEWYATVRIVADPDGEAAEYAVLVRSDMAGRGLGRLLMERIITHAQARGLKRIWGEVLRENHAMLGLCRKLGFELEAEPDEPELVRVTLELHRAAAIGAGKT